MPMETDRKIFKFNKEAIAAIRHEIQLGFIGSKDVTDTLLNLGFYSDDEDRSSLVLCSGNEQKCSELKLSIHAVASIAKLAQFSLMTKSSFPDLMRQVRMEQRGMDKLDTTPEYEDYFQSVITMRLQLASDIKAVQVKQSS